MKRTLMLVLSTAALATVPTLALSAPPVNPPPGEDSHLRNILENDHQDMRNNGGNEGMMHDRGMNHHMDHQADHKEMHKEKHMHHHAHHAHHKHEHHHAKDAKAAKDHHADETHTDQGKTPAGQ